MTRFIVPLSGGRLHALDAAAMVKPTRFQTIPSRPESKVLAVQEGRRPTPNLVARSRFAPTRCALAVLRFHDQFVEKTLRARWPDCSAMPLRHRRPAARSERPREVAPPKSAMKLRPSHVGHGLPPAALSSHAAATLFGLHSLQCDREWIRLDIAQGIGPYMW